MADSLMTIENGVLLKYEGRENRVVIPARVKTIAPDAFMRKYAVGEVIIPEGVTEIGDRAFFCCYGLKSVFIADSVKTIGENAFAYCSKLESVRLPEGLRVMNEMTFLQCSMLKEISLPDSLEVIGEGAFARCAVLELVNIPPALTTIARHAFYDCKRLKLTKAPDCIPVIGEDAFHGADPRIMAAFADAQKRLIPMYSACVVTVTNLRRHRYADHLQCTLIRGHNVIVDDTCRIGQRLVYFPAGGQLNEAFAKENHLLRYDETGNRTGCYLHPGRRNITYLRIHGEVSEGLAQPVEVLGKYTDIHALKDGDRIFTLNGHPICNAWIPDRMKIDLRWRRLESYRIKRGTPEKVYIPWGTEIIGDGAFMHCRRMTAVIIPETVVCIGRRAFYDCPDLKTVTIPDSVTRIGDEAFAHCGMLGEDILPERLRESARVIMDADDFEIRNGVLVKYRGDIRKVVIPEGVTGIGEGAFRRNCSIESVVMPEGVVTIGKYAFEDCRRLQNVTIPDSVREIGCDAFYRCRALREVTVPPGVERIGDHAFGKYYFFKYLYGAKFPMEEHRVYHGFCMHCKEGSAAEAYALKNRITYFTRL